jgi:hypothetical protein
MLLMLFVWSDPCVCQETAAQIDSALARWIELSDGSTASIRFCFFPGHRKNGSTAQCAVPVPVGKTDEEQKTLLRDSQRKWLAFREAEAKLASAVDPNAGGSLAFDRRRLFSIRDAQKAGAGF